MPIDGLKIDRVFIEGLGRRPEHTAIVTAALAFAEALGLDVVGEGVETSDQRSRLGDLGCRLGQGFFFVQPGDIGGLRAHLVTDVGERSDGRSAA